MLEKNQTYIISEEPLIVGVVKRVKCSRDNRWVIAATDGHEYTYNANSGSWSRGEYNFAEFEPLDDSKKLFVSPCGEASSDSGKAELDLVSGQMWEDESGERVMIMDASLNGEYPGYTDTNNSGHYCFVGLHVDRSLKDGYIEYYNINGEAIGIIEGSHNLVSKIVETVDFSLV